MADKNCPSFLVKVKGDIKEIIEEVRKLAGKNGVVFKGDENSGTFSGSHDVSGRYTVKGKEITIDYKTDSWLHDAVCGGAREKLEAFFKGK